MWICEGPLLSFGNAFLVDSIKMAINISVIILLYIFILQQKKIKLRVLY